MAEVVRMLTMPVAVAVAIAVHLVGQEEEYRMYQMHPGQMHGI